MEFHDPEKRSEIMHIGHGEYPRGWSSISCGYTTVEELKEKAGIPDEPCSVCGSIYTTSSSLKKQMLERKMCFRCNFWQDIVNRQDDACVRIGGTHYVIGKETGDRADFRGFGGRKFKIRFFDGLRGDVETTNLWHQGNIPSHFQKLIPDNAEFV